MLIQELKSIELLISVIIDPSIINSSNYQNITNKPSFKKIKTTLFNYISINNFIKHYHENPSFSLNKLLSEGRTTSEEPVIAVPESDIRYINNPNAFMTNLLKALVDENYVFDEENNIYISSEQIETIIPKEWLYIASIKYSKDKKEKLFIYNKITPNKLSSKEELIRYIRQSKSFICRQKNISESLSFSKAFTTAKSQTTSILKNMKSVKVDKIVNYFTGFIPKEFDIEIIKFHLPNEIYLVKKAQSHKDFYRLPFDKQEKIITEWCLEYYNNNLTNNLITQKFLVSQKEVSSEELSSKKDELLIGLFNLYISLITKAGIDFDNISLSKFELKEYISSDVVKYYQELKSLKKIIDALDNSDYKKRIMEDYTRVSGEIEQITQEETDKLKEKKSELDVIQKKYQENEANIIEYKNRVSTLTNLINSNMNYSISDIAFDNPRIIELIKKATFNGVVIQNPLDSKRILIEEQSGEIGKTIFKAEIKIESLIELIEAINNYLDEKPYKLA